MPELLEPLVNPLQKPFLILGQNQLLHLLPVQCDLPPGSFTAALNLLITDHGPLREEHEILLGFLRLGITLCRSPFCLHNRTQREAQRLKGRQLLSQPLVAAFDLLLPALVFT
ncbi:hypothetical protein D3C74_412230 [compost metagenome]